MNAPSRKFLSKQAQQLDNYLLKVVSASRQWSDDDDLAHIHDTRLCYVTRGGRAFKVTWNEMSSEERRLQRIADRREAEVANYNPCGLY